ncbi:MAG TPA: beta-galactosidase, partial [Candidatus Binatia bacterium]|nr:beta-galactosidase [Candidatus Binatia bacterium]
MKKALIVIAIILALFAAGCVYFASKYEPSSTTEWGITFSHRYAESLGYDWKVMYLDMLNDLKPKKLRLMAYWEDIEPQPNVYDFSKAALMLEEAGKRNIEVILVVGHKQPRWPECHHPDWYGSLSQEERDQAQLKMVENAVNYYKRFDAIKIWQVENEALFTFGHECPKTPVDLIQKEMEIVRKADSRPILMTDSG